MTSSPDRSLPRGVLSAALGAALLTSCAVHRPPSPEIVGRARLAPTYSASLQVSLRGQGLRGRTPVLLAFRRPDRMRIEIPGPSGLRLLAVVREGRLVATLPQARAVHEAPASSASLLALLGVELEPSELMDLLVGVASPRVSEYKARWGPHLPTEIQARLPDGTRLRARVEAAEIGESLPSEAFATPGSSGLRPVDADEARQLMVGR